MHKQISRRIRAIFIDKYMRKHELNRWVYTRTCAIYESVERKKKKKKSERTHRHRRIEAESEHKTIWLSGNYSK